MDWSQILSPALQAAVTVAVALIPIATPIVLNKLFDKWGATSDVPRREAVVTAIVAGLTLAIDRRGLRNREAIDIGTKEALAQEAADYAKKMLPDTIRKLSIPDENLPTIALTRIPDAMVALDLQAGAKLPEAVKDLVEAIAPNTHPATKVIEGTPPVPARPPGQ